MKKIRASQQKRNEIETVMKSGSREAIEGLHRLGQEKFWQELLEAEVDEHLGRDWYQRSEDSRQGYRNGSYPRKMIVPGGTLNIAVPRLRNTKEKFTSRLLKAVADVADRVRTVALEAYVRGLSVRDIEQTFVTEDGSPMLSRSVMSRVATRLHDEYLAFSQRDLSDLDVAYLFLDGVYESVRRYTNGQALLCAWAICSNGTKVLVHIAAAQAESEDAWMSFCEDLLRRGLRQPLLVISDGGPAVIKAITRSFPKADRQRCIAHKLRNIAAKLPRDVAKAIIEEFKGVYYAADRATAIVLAEQVTSKYAAPYPSAVQCFNDDLDACLTHLKYPVGHRRYIRTTNMLERTFEEEKRRTKVMPQHQNERSAVGLVFAVLHRVSKRWFKVSMTPLELTQLRELRHLVCPSHIDPDYISYRSAA
jgi:putative transposase